MVLDEFSTKGAVNSNEFKDFRILVDSMLLVSTPGLGKYISGSIIFMQMLLVSTPGLGKYISGSIIFMQALYGGLAICFAEYHQQGARVAIRGTVGAVFLAYTICDLKDLKENDQTSSLQIVVPIQREEYNNLLVEVRCKTLFKHQHKKMQLKQEGGAATAANLVMKLCTRLDEFFQQLLPAPTLPRSTRHGFKLFDPGISVAFKKFLKSWEEITSTLEEGGEHGLSGRVCYTFFFSLQLSASGLTYRRKMLPATITTQFPDFRA